VVSIPNELDQFNIDYIRLLDAVKRRIEEKRDIDVTLLHNTLNIVSELFNIYNYHALLIWPRQIKSKSDLNKLHLLVFSKIMGIYMEILNRFRSLIPNEEYLRDGIGNLIPSNLANIFIAFDEEKEEILTSLNLSKYGLGEQREPLIKYLLNINSSIKPTSKRYHEFIKRIGR
jgi:hypothetical protein